MKIPTYWSMTKLSLLLTLVAIQIKLKKKITAIDKPVAAILITHAHYDHIMGLDVIRDALDSLLFISLKKKRLGFIHPKIISQA